MAVRREGGCADKLFEFELLFVKRISLFSLSLLSTHSNHIDNGGNALTLFSTAGVGADTLCCG